MKIFQILLLPFTLIYSLVIRFRNHLFNIEYTKSFQFEIPVIVVGNLSAGGTGKTPMVEYLVRLLSKSHHPAVLSRGYKRKSKGFALADEKSTVNSIGDEPMQYHNKFDIPVAVGEDRVEAIPKILFEKPSTDMIIMDDGFQHRAVRPFLSILLTGFSNPFTSDYLIPSGRLREPRKEAHRSDVIIVTKCDQNLSDDQMDDMVQKIGIYSGNIPVFFTGITYCDALPLFNKSELPKNGEVILLTGIADPEPLISYIGQHWKLRKHLRYPDHHMYSESEIRNIANEQKDLGIPVITTEKDTIRLKSQQYEHILQNVPVFYLPISTTFIKNGAEFDNWIQGQLDSFSL